MPDANPAADISLSRETASGMAAKFVMAIAGFAGTVVFARLLDPAAFGGVYLVLALARVVDRPILGWATAGKQRLSAGRHSRESILGALLGGAGLWIVVVAVAAVAAAPLLAEYTGFPVVLAPVLVVVVVATTAVSELLSRLVEATGRVAYAMWVEAARAYVILGLQLVFVAAVGAAGMLYGIAAASTATAAVFLAFLSVRPWVPSRHVVADLWSYARGSIPTSVLETGYTRLDFLLIGGLLASASAGYYKVALTLTLPATFVSGALGPALMTAVASRSETALEDVRNAVAYSSVLALPLLGGALVIATPLVTAVYGPQYAAAGSVLIGLAVYRVVQTQTGPLLNAIYGLGAPGYVGRLTAFAVTVNVVLGVTLAARVGVVGIVVATVAAEAVRCVGARWWLHQRLDAGALLSRPQIEQAAATAVTTVAAVGVWSTPALPRTPRLAATIVVGAAAYSMLLLASSGHRSASRRLCQEFTLSTRSNP